LARALGVVVEKAIARYPGALCGVVDSADCPSVVDLSQRFDEAVGHKTILYPYGSSEIAGGRVAVVAGGGLEKVILEQVAAEGINVFITGITAINDYSRRAHDFARRQRISLLGGTHYSTEAFACKAMCRYFEKPGLECMFIEGEPGMEDL
jgi:putative NIF3 family GTP cyclohydrolase 1 type 2